MSLTSEARQVLKEEEAIYNRVIDSLNDQLDSAYTHLNKEEKRARILTSQIVAARQPEDKQLLAPDEAVSHAIRDQKAGEIKTINNLLKKPYFARFVLEEEIKGQTKNREYKLGPSGNLACRIIDWRNAPIARLYYEYREDDEFAEEIQGQEREGVVKLRNTISIKKGALKQVSCRYGTFIYKDKEWTTDQKDTSRAYGQLPDILSLITPEQYQTITTEPETPLILAGVAGSGKTAVALHRLAWLLHSKNSDLKPEECVVLVRSAPLKQYIINTLDALDLPGIEVELSSTWNAKPCRYIMIDEAQEYTSAELTTLAPVIYNADFLTVVGDTAQTIVGDRTLKDWKELIAASHYLSLTVSHRSTLPIMKLGDHIQKRMTVTSGRKGRVPLWFQCDSETEGIEAALYWLKQALERYPNALTAVICRDQQEARYVTSLLEPCFGAAVRLGSDYSFSFDAGIVVSDVTRLRGLEFLNVLIWNPSNKSYPLTKEGQNRLYIAITRAEENLCLATWGIYSRHLPNPAVPLTRLKFVIET